MQDPEKARRPAISRRAVIAVPARLPAVLAAEGMRELLARGRLDRLPAPASDLDRVLAVLGLEAPVEGQAAFRLWGATGSAPDGWVAGADPVWLQAGLDRLYLHAPPPGDVEPGALETLCRHVNERLFGEGDPALTAIGEQAYLAAAEPLPTAELPAAALDGERPDPFMPGAADRRYLELTGEIQMCLHDHPVNSEREAAGRRPLNALWLWGGGRAPAVADAALPPFIGDEPLLAGYWLARGQLPAAWPGSLERALAEPADLAVVASPAPGDFVAGFPALWRSRRLRQAVLLFRDGHRVTLTRGLRNLFRRPSAEILSMGGA